MTNLPFVSVLMPIRNEEKWIAMSAGAVLRQDYPPDRLELIVADGRSTDNTPQLLRELQSNSPIHLQVVDNPAQLMAPGFNRAFDASRGDIIIMMGGHTEIAPDYVRQCVALLAEGNAECVGGPIETICLDRRTQAIAAGMQSRFGVGGVHFRTGTDRPRQVDTVAFGAYLRPSIERAGLLDEELVRNQDDEFNYRLRKAGARIWLAPQIKARYYARASLSALWKQYYQYGFWKVRVLQKHPLQMQPRHFIPALFVLSLLTLLLLSFVLPPARLALAAVLLLYVIANLVATLRTALGHPTETWLLLPLVFATLHVSYGTGFLLGLIRFAGRWRETWHQLVRTPQRERPITG